MWPADILHHFIMFFLLCIKWPCWAIGQYCSLSHLHLYKTDQNSSPHWRLRSLQVSQQEAYHIPWCSGASQTSTNFSVHVQNATFSVMTSHFLQLWTWPRNIAAEHHLGTWPQDMTSQQDLVPWPRTITAVHDHGTWPGNMIAEDDLYLRPQNMTLD